jgi:hypothetical protein
VTRPDTVSEVFHFAVTRWVSRKKKAVAATRAIEIIQNDTPTKSSDFKLDPAAAKALLDDNKPIRTTERALSFFDFSFVNMRKFWGKVVASTQRNVVHGGVEPAG